MANTKCNQFTSFQWKKWICMSMQMEKCFSEMKTKDMEYIDNATINACENTGMCCSEQRRLIVRRPISIEYGNIWHTLHKDYLLLNQRKKKRIFMTTTSERMIVCASSDQRSIILYNQHSPLSTFSSSCDSWTQKGTHTRKITASQTYEIIHFKRRACG